MVDTIHGVSVIDAGVVVNGTLCVVELTVDTAVEVGGSTVVVVGSTSHVAFRSHIPVEQVAQLMGLAPLALQPSQNVVSS